MLVLNVVQIFLDERFGSLILCPAGGQAFATAYMMACDMRRRKRDAISNNVMRPATLTEMQNICCAVGCELRDLFSYCDPFGGFNS
ncbi:hypothetical protein Tcan_15479 [Toxocara canis]|uniref:Insulin-like domain-containing protein n=1 Tax=Toxocara canis TaxID=6265 RepID=A0A0B2V173_TOXCA|nr:hypothetical protein Tcan_15479 [Toxocara canis]